jgi:hypothetical protein
MHAAGMTRLIDCIYAAGQPAAASRLYEQELLLYVACRPSPCLCSMSGYFILTWIAR